MRQGFTLVELAVVILIVGFLLLVGLPRLAGVLDRIAVNRAAGELTTTLAVARNFAISYGMRTRVTIRRVSLAVSNPVIQYHGNGIGWGLSNTRVVLKRGSHSETITTSRLGRVKRW